MCPEREPEESEPEGAGARPAEPGEPEPSEPEDDIVPLPWGPPVARVGAVAEGLGPEPVSGEPEEMVPFP